MKNIMPYKGAWNNDDFMRSYIENLISEIGINNFNETYLRNNGHLNLLSAIRRTKFKAWLTYPQLPKLQALVNEKNYYKNVENIKKDIKYLVNKYKCVPPLEILQEEKMGSLIAQTRKYHNGIKNILTSMGLTNYVKESKLETCVKNILDNIIPNLPCIDNGHKILLNYGIDFQNQKTKQFYELDRFYINERVAIEIQGQQHFKKGGENSKWHNQSKIDRIKEIDLIKKDILKKCNVYLIEIPYNDASEKRIKDQLAESNRFDIRSFF